jgi:molybdopterin converting factor small subunit
MTVSIPTPLRSYTAGQPEVQAEGMSVAEVLATLEVQFPGFRFRIITEQDTIRPHIKIFINEQQISTLAVPVKQDDRVHIICALSGG